jgi:hypothetical protein
VVMETAIAAVMEGAMVEGKNRSHHWDFEEQREWRNESGVMSILFTTYGFHQMCRPDTIRLLGCPIESDSLGFAMS